MVWLWTLYSLETYLLLRVDICIIVHIESAPSPDLWEFSLESLGQPPPAFTKLADSGSVDTCADQESHSDMCTQEIERRVLCPCRYSRGGLSGAHFCWPGGWKGLSNRWACHFLVIWYTWCLDTQLPVSSCVASWSGLGFTQITVSRQFLLPEQNSKICPTSDPWQW